MHTSYLRHLLAWFLSEHRGSLPCARANPLYFPSWTFSVSAEARVSPPRRTLHSEGPTGSGVPMVHHTSSLSFLPTSLGSAEILEQNGGKNAPHPISFLGRRYFHLFPSKLKWVYLFLKCFVPFLGLFHVLLFVSLSNIWRKG